MKTLSLFSSIGLAGLVGLATMSARAQASSGALTLAEALATAERNHPDLVEAGALVRAAESRVHQAGVLPRPEAIARIENAPFAGRTTGSADYLAGVGVTLPLGNRREAATRAEDLDRQRLDFALDGKRLELYRRVHAAFAVALYQEQARELRAEWVSNAEQAVRLARVRAEVGDAVPADLALPESDLAAAMAEWKRSDLMRRRALAALSAAMGSPGEDVRAVRGSLASALEIPVLEELAADLERHPTVAAADAEVAAREAGVSLARVQRIPDLKAELLYHRIESTRRDAFDVGISLPLPLFDRGRGRIREAEAQRDAAEARQRSTRNDLRARLRETHANLAAALADVRALESEILPGMKLVRETAEARHAGGDIGLSELLSVRRDDALVRSRYLEALRDALLAWADLRPFLKP